MSSHRPTEVEVRRRAHQIYLERGCQPGHEVDDWLQAEYELMQLPVRKLAQIDPPKMRRRNPSEKTLISVVHAALLFGAGSLHRFQ